MLIYPLLLLLVSCWAVTETAYAKNSINNHVRWHSLRGNYWSTMNILQTIVINVQGHIFLHTHIPVPIWTTRFWNRQASPSFHLWSVLFYNEDNTVLGWFSSYRVDILQQVLSREIRDTSRITLALFFR